VRTGHRACLASKNFCDLPARKEGFPARLVRADTERRHKQELRKKEEMLFPYSLILLPSKKRTEPGGTKTKQAPARRKKKKEVRDGLLYSQRK